MPLAIIVLAFTITLGRRKLSEQEGRVLKLLSGTMMLGLGLVLVVDPTRLDNPFTVLGLVIAAILGTLLIIVIQRYRSRDH